MSPPIRFAVEQERFTFGGKSGSRSVPPARPPST
jgi:hypothetical protein